MFYCSNFFVAGVVLSVLRGVVGEEDQQRRCVARVCLLPQWVWGSLIGLVADFQEIPPSSG
jgi:hypothetical protein